MNAPTHELGAEGGTPSATPPPHLGQLGLWTGVGLVVANMVGAGVFLSMGFMVAFGGMGPLAVLVAWGIGAVFALLGTQAYGALAAHSGRSGGEYQLLSEHLHPAVGWVAGWASLLLGFSAPIAVDALAVGAYAAVLAPDLVDPRLVATLTVLALAGVHSMDQRSSRWAQDALLVVKGLLLVGFVLAGLALGARAWPTWVAPGATSSDLPWRSILDQQYWVASRSRAGTLRSTSPASSGTRSGTFRAPCSSAAGSWGSCTCSSTSCSSRISRRWTSPTRRGSRGAGTCSGTSSR